MRSINKNLLVKMFVSKLENLKHLYAMMILFIAKILHDLQLIYFLLINFILILLQKIKMLFVIRLNTFKLILISFKKFLRVTIFLINFMKYMTIKAIYFLMEAQKLLMQKKKYF